MCEYAVTKTETRDLDTSLESKRRQSVFERVRLLRKKCLQVVITCWKVEVCVRDFWREEVSNAIMLSQKG